MKEIKSRDIIRKLLKKAEPRTGPLFHPTWSGMSSYSDRGIKWVDFNEGRFSNLPDGLVAQISNTRSAFKESFSDFAINDKTGNAYTSFRGVIFTAYAADFIGNDIPAGTRFSPEQNATINFAKKYNIIITAEKEIPAKQTGTDFWLSHHAYAWKDKFGDEIVDVGSSQSSKVVTVTNPELSRSKGYEYGPVQITQTPSGGFGIFINTDEEGSGNGLVPILGMQTPQNMDKFFISPGANFGGLRPNQSNIILPEGPKGNRVEYARQPRPRNRDGMLSDELAKVEQINESIRNARQEGTLWKLMLADDSTLYAKRDSDGRQENLSESIVRQLIKPEYFQSMQEIRPAKTREDQVTEPGVGNMGRWKVSDRVKNIIMGDPSNPYANPESIAALRALRIDINKIRGSDRAELNGYYTVTIGPKFSNPQNIGKGQTTSAPGFVTPQTMVNPSDESTVPVVERGEKWVVLVDEYQEERLKYQGRKNNPQRQVSEFSDLAVAFNYAKSRFISKDGVTQDTSAFVAGEKSVRIAMDTLKKSFQSGIDTNKMPDPVPSNLNSITEVADNIKDDPINNIDSIQDNRTASYKLKKMIKKMSL